MLEHSGKVMLKSATFPEKTDCRTCMVDGALFCNDATVAIATTQVILDLYQTFYAQLVGNTFTIFST